MLVLVAAGAAGTGLVVSDQPLYWEPLDTIPAEWFGSADKAELEGYCEDTFRRRMEAVSFDLARARPGFLVEKPYRLRYLGKDGPVEIRFREATKLVINANMFGGYRLSFSDE